MSEEDKTMFFDGFEDAFMGSLRRCGESIPVAVYDYSKCMKIMMEKHGMEEDEAVEWIEFNCLGGWVGEGTPCMMFRCTLNEMKEECNAQTDPDGDRDPGDETDDEIVSEKDEQLIDEALRDYATNFIRYVKEVDNSIYIRAKEYACDYSGNDRITFFDMDKKPRKDTDE